MLLMPILSPLHRCHHGWLFCCSCGDPLAGSPSLTQSRHRTHLTQCLHHLSVYLAQVRQCDTVLAAQALRRAMRQLGKVTGAVDVEDVLDVIFKDFCIGK